MCTVTYHSQLYMASMSKCGAYMHDEIGGVFS